jgi:hypothetical protein
LLRERRAARAWDAYVLKLSPSIGEPYRFDYAEDVLTHRGSEGGD